MGFLRVSVALLAAIPFLVAACGGGGNGAGGTLEEILQGMVLQPEDLPEGLSRGEELFTTNDQLVSASADPEARRAMLERWGRLLGYEITYQPNVEALGDSPVKGISVSASLYREDEGASESFADAAQTAEETDWAATYTGLTDFQQEMVDVGDLANEIVWLRLTGFQPASSGPDALVTDDLIFFRVGRGRGFLRVLGSTTETEDRRYYEDRVEEWLQTLVQRVRDIPEERGSEVEE